MAIQAIEASTTLAIYPEIWASEFIKIGEEL
jgi:hypothetical protein